MPIRSPKLLSRAQGCLLGQLAGDALGSLVEFQSPEEIRRNYPDGVRELADGGTWNTIAGQPTDDSEMALLLARMLTERGTYDPDAALRAYQFWLDSDPFDCGMTIATGLRGSPNPDSQANGAMMRISPLDIFGAMRGGDTDTNAAICGALLGAVYGLDAIPGQWVERVLNCRPKAGHPGVNRPRSECFWPVDALELADRLIQD